MAKQVSGAKDNPGSNAKKNFFSQITKYHPDKHRSSCAEQANVLIEAYGVLTGRIKTSDCKFLQNDYPASSLLPKRTKPAKSGVKYEEWLKDMFYDFANPTRS